MAKRGFVAKNVAEKTRSKKCFNKKNVSIPVASKLRWDRRGQKVTRNKKRELELEKKRKWERERKREKEKEKEREKERERERERESERKQKDKKSA